MKTSIKIAMVMMIASLFSAPVFASDVKVGVGIGATETGAIVYIPVKVPMAKDHVLVEPFFSSSNETIKVDGTTTKKETDNNIGIGLFYGKAMTDNIDLMLGARLSFAEKETKNVAIPTKQDGYAIAPAIGIEYNINKNVAVGGYVEYAYTNVEDKPSNTTTKTETETFKTGTNLFVKFFF